MVSAGNGAYCPACPGGSCTENTPAANCGGGEPRVSQRAILHSGKRGTDAVHLASEASPQTDERC